MNIYVYSDESGVFDYLHNDYFVFGGIICFGTDNRDDCCRKYSHVEQTLRASKRYDPNIEIKASNITNNDKGKLYRSLNNCFKFCVLISEKKLKKEIFENKKHKQRYLDYAFKIVLKKCFSYLISKKYLNPECVECIYVNVDEHTTATDAKYELEENLRNEFKFGTFNPSFDIFYKPIFPRVKDVVVKYCDSRSTRLVRAADIVANHCLHSAVVNIGLIRSKKNMFVYLLP